MWPVKDPIIARFAEACGATAPLALRVDLVDVGRRAEGSVAMPFSLVGRDDACDVTLTDPEVNPRHAWLQVIAGRVLAVDLGSRAGLGWPGQGAGSGWLDVGVPVRIGPFQLRLCSGVSSRPSSFPTGYSPLQSDTAISRSENTVTLEFRNGKRARDRWNVNRLVTLVGRAPECKIRLSADDIAGYHCGLVLTPSGLWVVDLSGRGVVVNGERMRVSPLRHGSELWVGRFLIGLQSRNSSESTAPGRAGISATTTVSSRPHVVSPPPNPANPAEDEVPVGIAPPADASAGLPSSHIMADAFQIWATTTGGAMSNPILVSGSGPTPTMMPVSAGTRTQQGSIRDLLGANRPQGQPPSGAAGIAHSDAATAATVVGLLRELGDLHGQMLNQFQQSLGLMVRLFACLGREQLPAMQRELVRIQELNSELAHLQAELARRAAEQPVAQTPPPRVVSTTSTPTPVPDSTSLHDWVADRIGTLQRERQARWQSLVGLFAATETRGQ